MKTVEWLCRCIAAVSILATLGACTWLDELTLDRPRTWDPTKVYLKDEYVTLRKHDDMDRYVCLSGPLQCQGFGLTWDCSCF